MTGQQAPAKTGGFRITLRRGQETHVRAKLYCDIGIAPVTVELVRDLDPDDPFRKQPDVFIYDALNESGSARMRTNAGTILAVRNGDLAGNKDKEIQVIGYTVAVAGMPIGTLEANVYLEATVKTAEGLDMTGVIIETHSPPMGEPFPVEKRITTNYHQSFVPPKTPFTMFPPSRRMRAAPVPQPKPIRQAATEEPMNQLSAIRSELETEGLLDAPPLPTPITPEGGELMQSETKKPAPSLKVKAEVDDLDLKTPGNRALVITVVEGDIPRGMVVGVNALISQDGRRSPERKTTSFANEEGRWVARFAITNKGGTAHVFSPDKIFDDSPDIPIPDMSGDDRPAETTDVHMRLPELNIEVTEVSSGSAEGDVFADGSLRPLPEVPTQESKPENHRLPRPAGVKKLKISDAVEDSMPAPTAAPPASSDDAEWDGPKTAEIPNPTLNAAILESMAPALEQPVHVPPDVMAALDTTPPRGVNETTQPDQPAPGPAPGPEKQRSALEIYEEVKKKHEQRTASPVPTKLSPRESNGLEVPVRPSELIAETPPAPKAPDPPPVAALPPKPAVRMGPAPPPPPPTASPLATIFDDVVPPPAPPAEAAPASKPTPPVPIPETGPVEALAVEPNQPAAAPAKEPAMTAHEPPVPEHTDTGPTKPMAPVPSQEKMTLARRAAVQEEPKPVPKPEQQPPSPPPGIQEVPLTNNPGPGGNPPPVQDSSIGAFAVKAVIVLAIATVAVVAGFYFISHLEGGDKKERAPKEHVEDKPEKGHADEEPARFGDERDEKGDHALSDDDVANCRVAIGDGDKTMPVEQWFEQNKKDPDFEGKYPIATKNGRPIIQIKPKGEKVGVMYVATWTADWHVDCSRVSDK